MNASLRMILVLGLIAAVAAGTLAGINAWTGPIIDENATIRLNNTLGSLVDADEFEEQEDTEYPIWHAKKGGELVGYIVRLLGQGYSSSGIDILVGLDTEATVTGVLIFSHSETPGLGDVIFRESFLGQFEGKGLEDPIASGDDVDIITGSTSSTMAVINTVRRAVQVIGLHAGLIEDVVVDFADIPDGVYTGVARGFGGDIEVEVTFEGGELTNIEILSHNDTPSYFEPVKNRLPQRIIDAQDLDVDIISGSTASSEGVINAIRNALAEFLGEDDEDEVTEEPIDLPALASGRYIATVNSFGGDLTVEVIMEDGEIKDIIIVDHNDTPDFANPAFEKVIANIIDAQDFDVDLYSGSTVSSEALIEAVKTALRSELVIDISGLEDGIYMADAASFNGPLTVKVTVESGAITSIEIDHQDTLDIADPAFNQVVGEIKDTQGLDVDMVAGATVSVEALVKAIRTALVSGPTVDVSTLPDGVYEGTGKGFMDDIVVAVTVEGGKIVGIEVVSHDETPDFANPAFTAMIENIEKSQHYNVDLYSGSTGTAEGLLEAVEAALRSAKSQ